MNSEDWMEKVRRWADGHTQATLPLVDTRDAIYQTGNIGFDLALHQSRSGITFMSIEDLIDDLDGFEWFIGGEGI